MAVQRNQDPITGEEIIVVRGTLDGIYFNELKTVRTYANGWTPTHSITAVVEGVRVNLQLTDKEEVNARDRSGQYHALSRGMEVAIKVEEDNYTNRQGVEVEQYKSSAKDVTVLDASGAVKESQGGSKPAGNFKRDNSGVIAGNGFNAAKVFLGAEASAEDLIEAAKNLIDIGESIRTWLKEQDSSLDDYSIGARAGMALIAACEVSENYSEVEGNAKWILSEVLPAITEYAKELEGGAGSKPPAKKVAKKTAKRAAKAAPEKTVADLDDDIPF